MAEQQSYLASLYSYVAGSSPLPAIKVVKSQPALNHDRELLPPAAFPSPSLFTWNSLIDETDTVRLQVAVDRAREDVKISFSSTITLLQHTQHDLEKRTRKVDALARRTLKETNARNKVGQNVDFKELRKLTALAESTYNEVAAVIALFRDIDRLLPERERIGIHANHYRRLAPLISDVKVSPAVLSLHSNLNQDELMQEGVFSPVERSSPRSSSKGSEIADEDVTTTSLTLADELSRVPQSHSIAAPSIASESSDLTTISSRQELGIEPVIDDQSSTAAHSSSPYNTETPKLIKNVIISTLPDPKLETPRLRLAPRKSISNLRITSLKTLPPVASPQLSLPNFERDNDSMHSIASRRSIFSVSTFFSRRAASESTASDRLRQVLRPSTS